MAGDKDTSRQLRDLADLRDQLEQVRDRIEGEGSVVLSSPFYRGCLIGLLIGRLRGAAFLGASVGLITGAYAAQNYNLPNVGDTLESWFRAIKGDDED